MKKSIVVLILAFLLNAPAFADKLAFIASENGRILKEEGACGERYAPCSTFKIPLSLMGYDAGIFIDEHRPEWPFQEGYAAWLERWKEPHTPTLWMKNSCVWYSQVLTKQLGLEEFQKYVSKLNYGNQDISGDKGKNNGLTNAWLSSSLEISPLEQIEFLQKLVTTNHPVSFEAQRLTRNILFLEDLSQGWKLYGKTGSGNLLSPDRTEKLELQHGWFVGWIEKNNRTIVFANHLTEETEKEGYAGPRAKLVGTAKALKLIKEFGEE